MEERRFDELTRVLGAATSRRQMLRGMLGGVLAAVVGRALAPSIAEAASGSSCQDSRACRDQAEKEAVSCYQDASQSLGNCINGSGPYGGLVCYFFVWRGAAARCERGYLADTRSCRNSGCVFDDACCNGACINVRSGDPSNCGSCGHNCPSGAKCINSQCYCDTGETPCDNICVDLDTSSTNCGACGTACDPGQTCIDGKCQCNSSQTLCGTICVDTQSDNINCGTCAHACGSCERCLGGVCQPLDCGSGTVCCQHLCVSACHNGSPDPDTCLCDVCDGQANGLSCGPGKVCCDQHCTSEACPQGKTFDLDTCACTCTPVTCPTGQTQDLTTCQCISICTTASAGTSCGADMECCQHQCVSTQCPTGKHFDLNSCACICDPITCASGAAQDPTTCQCPDKCADVTCDTCQTCDPTSGECVNADNGTDCDDGKKCCNGTCQSDCVCTGLSCANGDCCPNSDDWSCCENGCCPQVVIGALEKEAYCLASGSWPTQGEGGITIGGCCQPNELMKYTIVDPDTNTCVCDNPDYAYQAYCDGNMPTTYFGSPTCSCGPWIT